MEFIKPGINIDFVGYRKYAILLSGALILVSILSLVVHGGPNLGVDFRGGTLVQLKVPPGVGIARIREGLEAIGIRGAEVQRFGDPRDNEYIIRVEMAETGLESLSDRIRAGLEKRFGSQTVEIRRVEMVGPKAGKELTDKALFALFFAILFIAVYISGRFEMKWMPSALMALSIGIPSYLLREIIGLSYLIILAVLITLALCVMLRFRYALGAVVALIHDVIITVGAFSLTNKEFTLPIVAALLTIIGYSLNDTIVVFDRIRENLKKLRRRALGQIVNTSINETLSRTTLTSLTTLLVVVVLFLIGGGVIHDFAFALLVGVIVGTYSSIFVASPILLFMEKKGGTGRRRSKR
ncbi:MAG: protein translocase subunit SecF [Deltaproteobacteria bacterium]|nr:protein translocase subunit SecF [Deltaproteobacteria bacterium]MBW2123512.1 protein translocase subunit SecF [Deltaproteobacteria bacterium]